jgi:hypothetical protein
VAVSRKWAFYDRAAKQLECLSCSEVEAADASVVAAGELSAPTAPQSPPDHIAPEQAAGDAESAKVESGSAGASARREHQRRVAKREKFIREAHPLISGFLLAITDDPQSTQAWQCGALGERAAG